MNNNFRIAINGYGRIGQCVLRALYENGYRQRMQVVAINQLADPETVAYLTRYDTTHGRFPGTVAQTQDGLRINGDRIAIQQQPDPSRLPWQDLGVDLVLECTGALSRREQAEAHLKAGAPRVLYSEPASPDVDKTVVFGVNHHVLTAADTIVSNASCTTNAIVPVIRLLHAHFGVERGMLTTIHAAMNDQPAIDTYHHPDLRRNRSAMASIIPVDTGLARGIDRLLPELTGRFTANAVRVPTLNVSMIDLTAQLARKTSKGEVNRLIRDVAADTALAGVLGWTDEPLTSSDFNHDPRSAVVDLTQTQVSDGHMVKLMVWFDNEWGFANRMLDTALAWLDRCEAQDRNNARGNSHDD
ncbi:MAG: type I glyceraldehyde-3-phosphate dehydrogenase [Gammaproteobacteria bacterium]|nr:MAG: type I glyceraldehyde-3-phosphate dehydrogenase [Gammaproteobacteria bacterium]